MKPITQFYLSYFIMIIIGYIFGKHWDSNTVFTYAIYSVLLAGFNTYFNNQK